MVGLGIPVKRKAENGSAVGPRSKMPASLIQLDAGFMWNLQALSKAAASVQSGAKSPVSALNELGVHVNYELIDYRGPAHSPFFTVCVTVADMRFHGAGSSKREARASAAKSCLSSLLAKVGQIGPSGLEMDFTSDQVAVTPMPESQAITTHQAGEVPVKLPSTASPASSLFGAGAATSPQSYKSPINMLYETYPTCLFVCTYGDGTPLDSDTAPLQLNHSMRFKVVCHIEDKIYEGFGSSKKQAKLAAARSAMASVVEARSLPVASDTPMLPQGLADLVAKLVNEKFNELMKNDLVHLRRKVLAGFVITVDNSPQNAKVIAVTTGTKCVSGEHMSVRGRAVNDCHAEVAARRCLQRYLYSQLLMYANADDPKQIIEQSDLEPLPEGGYKLKDNRQIHLYISTAPCGDGRIFSPHESHCEPDKHPNRLARGQLRTKIESGEGTIPVKNSNLIQTWDGVLQGERLLTMSCSDKVARWCVTGLQGALLARLLRPVYVTSLVLGSLLHTEHMYRAICGRYEGYLQALPPPYRLVAPLLARAASTEARTPARAPTFTVVWCSTNPSPEIINAVTGKLENDQPSLLCKQAMFARWQYLMKKLPPLPEEGDSTSNRLPQNLDSLLYNEAKQISSSYQVAKQCLMTAFEKAHLGKWVKKPIEQDQFQCEITDADPSILFA
ncbi:double-stranded RNA-specific editase Adar isoform X2 [Leptidea sinapis]|nr:double-stranded RNA-specific editase Adar isoform X2 [Leptidea sinapis]